MAETTITVEGMRAYPHGELFFLTKSEDGFDALVYNTTGRRRRHLRPVGMSVS